MDAGGEWEGMGSGSFGSNLGMALRVLPRARRRDMELFYRFCREVDDLADEPWGELSERQARLALWMRSIRAPAGCVGEPRQSGELRRMLDRYEVPREWVCELVRGCEMDLEGAVYRDWESLRVYCFRVASAVGLVSARIFGGVGCEEYAEELGLALQMTNILRDAEQDFRELGRVYLPREELEAFGVEAGAWCRGEPAGWGELMGFQAERVRGLYAKAAAALPRSQQRVMVAAEIMRSVYGRLFDVMVGDGFRVWERRYRLGKMRKLWVLGSVFVQSCVRDSLWRRRGEWGTGDF